MSVKSMPWFDLMFHSPVPYVVLLIPFETALKMDKYRPCSSVIRQQTLGNRFRAARCRPPGHNNVE